MDLIKLHRGVVDPRGDHAVPEVDPVEPADLIHPIHEIRVVHTHRESLLRRRGGIGSVILGAMSQPTVNSLGPEIGTRRTASERAMLSQIGPESNQFGNNHGSLQPVQPA